VAVSFAILALAPGALGGLRRRVRVRLRWPPLAGAVRWLSFIAFAGLIAAGFLGPTDPLENPLPVTLWTLWWVGYTALTALVGDSWRLLNPWSAPVGLLRRLGLRPALRLPAWIGHWPALAGLFAFVWLEIVSLAPADPKGLARAAAFYWLIHLAAMLLFGEGRWRARGETFSVFFRLIGRVAPLSFGPRGMTLAWPGARLAGGPALRVSGWLFVTSTIASVSFDGLSATFFWLGTLGINPLAFPGRSAVVAQNSIGLAAAWVAMALAYAGAVAAGARIAGSPVPLGRTLGRIGLSLVPIALAYHLAHYLTILMLDAQNAAAIAAEALGLGHVHVSASFLNDMDSVVAIWRTQTALIVGGHVLAVVIAHAAALELERAPRRAALSQLPLAGLMIALTLLGLWLLSAPTGA
ncbi:MAG TPA: hypothetical protein VFJ13_08240, partial [Paracoccaceae bacterium]|nr:hypothetical protein [Paracoccaceae bacterium]